MAHVIRILKASRLKSKWKKYRHEKEFEGEDESDIETPRRKKFAKLRKKLGNWFLVRFVRQSTTQGTFEHTLWKSLFGFIGGVTLTYIFFFFFHLGVNMSIRSSTYACAVAGIVLCLGMAFSSKVRCYVFLLLPVLFSKQGRQALMAYALFLSFTGPARNSMHNMGILSDSMACGQEMIRRTLRQVIEMVKAPFRSIKETLEKINQATQKAIEAVKEFMKKIKRIILAVLNVIKKATSWLGSIINFCNKKVGTPFQRCMRTFDDAITDCKAKLGVMDFLCHVVHLVKALCYTVKWLDFICMFTEFVSEKVIGVVKKKLHEFSLYIKMLFYVSIEFSHTYEFEMTSSNSTKVVAKTILQKIGQKVEKVQSMFSVFGFLFSFLFLFVFIKVYYYKYKYLTSDRFDNMYISKYITDLDMKRSLMNKETVLPLEPREKNKYAKPTSLRILQGERSRMMSSMFLLSLTTFKVISFIFCDYTLFWILLTIYESAHDVFEEEEPSKVALHVEGNGVLADFYRNLGDTFQVPKNPNLNLNPLHCLPDPVTPDTGRYMQIGFLVFLCWILTVTEAYGLRLRNVVMSYYYPDRARERAIWLYNHILQSRGSFIRFARRQLRRKFQGDDGRPVEKVTFTQRLFAKFPLLSAIFGKNKLNACLLCGAPETSDNTLKRCKTPDCPGRYCLQCFFSLENICTICQHPIEYGDISDISEEVDSSEEDLYKKWRGQATKSSDKNGKTVSFKDIQIRDRFRDIEAQRKLDLVKLSDFENHKDFVRKRAKAALKNYLDARRMELEKNSNKENLAKRLKSKLQDFIASKKKAETARRKSELNVIKNKLAEKVDSLKKSKEKEVVEFFRAKPYVSDVTLDYTNEIQPQKPKEVQKKLRSLVEAKIKAYKENKAKSEPKMEETPREHNEENLNNSEEPSENLKEKNQNLTYYFQESRPNPDFYVPLNPRFNEASSEDLILLEDDAYVNQGGWYRYFHYNIN